MGNCTIKPGVEVATKATSPKIWSVNGAARANAHLVSRDAEGRPVYGGTPADFAVVQAIREMNARGLRVTFYPFLLMDVPPGNTLPNPYSANAATPGQPSFPRRGRITCSPAAGYAGTGDKAAAVATQVASFFGAATPAQFAVSADSVSWTSPSGDWGLRRMILHYAHLCAVAGGVNAFLIGTEMRGLTTIRSSGSSYPAVTAFKALAADVKTILGPGTKVGYASDWSEYFGHQPGDGSGDVYFHLDAIQRTYLEGSYLWWGQAMNNPTSSVYGGRMVHVPGCAALSVLSGTDRHLDGRAELAAWALADRAAARGVAGGSCPPPLSARWA